MNTAPKIEISETTTHGFQGEPTTLYHWTIYDGFSRMFSHSAYHRDRAECEREAADRLVRAQAEDQI